MENLLAETLADGYSCASMRISSIAHYAHEEKITQPILSIAVIRGPARNLPKPMMTWATIEAVAAEVS
jgi:hypothetical protein